jgi:hypothetical protein
MKEKLARVEALLTEHRWLYWVLAFIAIEWPFAAMVGTDTHRYWHAIELLPENISQLTAKAVGATLLLSGGIALLFLFAGLTQNNRDTKVRSRIGSLGFCFAYSLAIAALEHNVFGYLQNWWLFRERSYLVVSIIFLAFLYCWKKGALIASVLASTNADKVITIGRVVLPATVILLISGWIIAPLTSDKHDERFTKSLIVYLENPDERRLDHIANMIEDAHADNVSLSTDFYSLAMMHVVQGCKPQAYLLYKRLLNERIGEIDLDRLERLERYAAIAHKYGASTEKCLSDSSVAWVSKVVALKRIVCSHRQMSCDGGSRLLDLLNGEG